MVESPRGYSRGSAFSLPGLPFGALGGLLCLGGPADSPAPCASVQTPVANRCAVMALDGRKPAKGELNFPKLWESPWPHQQPAPCGATRTLQAQAVPLQPARRLLSHPGACCSGCLQQQELQSHPAPTCTRKGKKSCLWVLRGDGRRAKLPAPSRNISGKPLHLEETSAAPLTPGTLLGAKTLRGPGGRLQPHALLVTNDPSLSHGPAAVSLGVGLSHSSPIWASNSATGISQPT